MQYLSPYSRRGFTIVELLIVIVVIGILAAITIVAFNGVQKRADYAKVSSDLGAINKLLQVYHAENGSYPATTTVGSGIAGWRYACATGVTNFIPELNSYGKVPKAPCRDTANQQNDTWLYGSDGLGYKLLHLRAAGSIEDLVPVERRDTRWGTTNGRATYGYWKDSDGSSFWRLV